MQSGNISLAQHQQWTGLEANAIHRCHSWKTMTVALLGKDCFCYFSSQLNKTECVGF